MVDAQGGARGPVAAVSGADAPSRAVTGLAEDDAIRETLGVLADDIVTHAGFGAAVVSVRCSDTELRTVVCAGDERVRDSLLDSVMPLAALRALLQVAQPWGNLHFVPDARVEPAAVDGSWTWFDDAPVGGGDPGTSNTSSAWWNEKPWEKENALLAPLLREDGEVLGLVSVDLPADGRRPNEAQRVALAVYARQAERIIAAAALRIGETHQLSLAHAARLIVREAGMQHHVSELLPRARAALLSNFAVRHAWIKSSSPEGSFGAADGEAPLMAPSAGSAEALPESLLPALTRAAQVCWEEQTVLEVSRDSRVVAGMRPDEVEELLDFFVRHQVCSALIVPLGSGGTRLGSMVLGRSADGHAWSDAEKAVALDIGHDIGRAMVHTLWFQAQQRATEELRQHTEYKRELLMTMSHELQTPLASIRAHVELIAPDLAEDSTVGRALVAIDRGSDRLTKLVNNMLWLARIDDPRRPVETERVDVVEAVRMVVEDATFPDSVRLVDRATTGPITGSDRELHLEVPDEPVWVRGTQSELVLACCNLVANALKYTDEGGRVRVEVQQHDGTAELVVTDDGIGIAPEETQLIFDDFYRSPSAAARRRPGSGLGLGIVKRIVDRHDGHISVDASVPSRTTFRLGLPTAGSAGQA